MMVKLVDVLEHLVAYNEMEANVKFHIQIHNLLTKKANFDFIEKLGDDTYNYGIYELKDYDTHTLYTVALGEDVENNKGLYSYTVEEFEAKCNSNEEAKIIKLKINDHKLCIDFLVEMKDGKNYWDTEKANKKHEDAIKELEALL